MGRLESLTALALGRGHYEDEVIRDPGESSNGNAQQFNDRGYPRNPETKRREKEQVRAANEVMQITGVVEDSNAAKAKASQILLDKTLETFTGLRLMEVGRAVLVGGVWGVLGLRRRILLYRPYSAVGVPEILRREASIYTIPHMIFVGLPTVIAYHAFDWVAFVAESLLDTFFDEDDHELSSRQRRFKTLFQGLLDIGFYYITLHFRMFAILQQLNLMPSPRLLPSFMSFIPFSASSPLQLPMKPSLNLFSVLSWCTALIRTAAPLLVIMGHGKIKYAVSQIIYRPIYRMLPRPTGDSMFSGLAIQPPIMEYDTPDHDPDIRNSYRSEDEPTLRALEGLPALERIETRSRQNDRDSSDEEEDELSHATLISFDVEPTEVVETSLGQWSAELRSANEPKPTEDVKYRITGLTMLPPIMATEALREIFAGIIVLPLEAVMVRVIGRAYRASAGLDVNDLYLVQNWPQGFGNLLSSFTIQLAVTGIVWAGFTGATQWWAIRNREIMAEKENKDVNNS